jgi:8-oxo-dGTP diphosphatase
MSVALAADVVILTVRSGRLHVLLVERAHPPFAGSWVLPGGFVEPDDDLDTAARRELAEETGIGLPAEDVDDPAHVEQLRTYGTPGRDPRGRIVSVAYLAMVPDAPEPHAGDDAARARYWDVTELAGIGARDGARDAGELQLAFDHNQIVADALERARAKLEYTTLATAFVHEPFTVADLRGVYEAVWGVDLHEANFRRKVLSTPGFVLPTGESVATAGRPARLHRRGPARRLHPPILRPGVTV